MALFKYFSPDVEYDPLGDSKLMVTPPKYLSDPFEWRPTIECKEPQSHARQMLDEMCESPDYFNSHRADFPNVSTFEQFRSELKKDELARLRQFEELIRQTDSNTQKEMLKLLSESFGVICFTANNANQQLWDRYKSHTGFAIEFREDHLLFSGRSFLHVEYSNDPIIYDASAPPDRDQVESFIKRKTTGWRYEEESRLIVKLADTAPGNTPKGPRHFIPIDPDIILSVTLGLRRAEGLKNRIAEVLDNPSFQHVQLLQIVEDSKKTKFDRVAI